MVDKKTILRLSVFVSCTLFVTGCTTKLYAPDLGGLYNDLAQNEDPDRNPVIVIPGILGSRLADAETGRVVWGAFGPTNANPKKPDDARRIALPMREGASLEKLRDNVHADGSLDRVKINLLGLRLELKAYFNILSTLGVAGYRDKQLGEAGVIDYGEGHFTCFQYAYDWRRDIVESAKHLNDFILDQRRFVQDEIEKRYGIKNHDVKFDIVAHSMGGLVARYYLRYGAADLPEDGALPPVTWAGSRYVEHVIFIGPPNGGSASAVIDLVEGRDLGMFLPKYSSTILGTMPSIYQLLPRSRHGVLVDSKDPEQPIGDIYDPGLWERLGWGLADPAQEPFLAILLPDVEDPETRRRIALDHQHKTLQRAKHFTAALDVPASPPKGLSLHLVAGDAIATDSVMAVDTDSGAIEVMKKGPGDGVVLRSSALMDERIGSKRTGQLQTPIDWANVQFLFTDHLGLTKDPAFTDNVLFILLEKPRGH